MTRLKEKGVYLLTGGLGGIGLTLAEYLAKRVNARLILTCRGLFPSQPDWDHWLKQHPEQDHVSHVIRQLQHMEGLGAEIMVCCADVTDARAMQEAVVQAKDRWGDINGVIHCAGIPGGGLIQRKTRAEAGAVMAPKVHGVLVLNRVLKDMDMGTNLDFFLLCSSINSVVSLLGQVDYYAANAFLDAFAFYKNAVDGIFTVSMSAKNCEQFAWRMEAV